MNEDSQVATVETPTDADAVAETKDVELVAEAEEELFGSVASSAADVIASAKARQAKRIVTVPFAGTFLKIKPASRTQYYSVANLVRKMHLAGRAPNELLEADIAWVAACVIEPKFEYKQVMELANAAPADFSTLATLCEQISSGTPSTILCLGIWGQHISVLRELEADGTIPEGTWRFYAQLIKVFNSYLVTAEQEKAPDFRDLAQRLLNEDDETNVEAANDAVQEWLKTQEEEAKNVSEQAETSPSTPPA